MTELYAVAGKPIAHSLSPELHNAAFEALGMDAVYVRLAARDLKDALATAKSMGIAGMNVTAPFKETMALLCGELIGEAKELETVNTVLFRDEDIIGHNTDAYGVKAALEANGVPTEGSKAIVLGAGGAAKAAALALMSSGAGVIVANRTEEKAESLALEMGCPYCTLDGLEETMPGADIVVSTLSTAERVVPTKLFEPGMAVLDAKYDVKTALWTDAESKGCKTIDGREWLLYQGAKAFGIFTGKAPPVDAMRKAVYAGRTNRGAAKTNIALIGFMGSGKTSVAKEIAGAARCAAVDTDADIEKNSGKKIADIFENHGEPEFRKLERDEVAKIAKLKRGVVACGGGVILDAGNVRVLREHCKVAWLWADAKEIFHRIKDDKSRPLLNHPDRENAARQIMTKRLTSYASASDIVVGTEGKTPAEIAELVLYEIGDAFKD